MPYILTYQGMDPNLRYSLIYQKVCRHLANAMPFFKVLISVPISGLNQCYRLTYPKESGHLLRTMTTLFQVLAKGPNLWTSTIVEVWVTKGLCILHSKHWWSQLMDHTNVITWHIWSSAFWEVVAYLRLGSHSQWAHEISSQTVISPGNLGNYWPLRAGMLSSSCGCQSVNPT